MRVLTRLLVQHHVSTDLAAWRGEVLTQTELLIPALGQIGAHAELAKAWRMIQFVYGPVCQCGQAGRDGPAGAPARAPPPVTGASRLVSSAPT